MKKSALLLIFLAVRLLGTPIISQVEVSTDTFRIGELIDCKITIRYPGNFTLIPPSLSFFPEKIEIREKIFTIPKKSTADKRAKAVLTYKITGFEPGEYHTNEFEIELKDNGEIKKITVGKFKLTITEFPLDGHDIRDIKPPLNVPNYEAIIVFVFVLFLIASAIYLYKHKKKKPQQNIEGAPAKWIDPAEIAREKLNALLSKNLLSEGKIKEFYIELSEIFRNYLAQKHNIAVIEKTTTELFQSLKSVVDKKYNLQTKEFLESCDVVKFAKYVPVEDKIKENVQKMKDLLL